MTSQRGSSLTSSSGTASGSRENMTGPQEHESTENRLHNAALETRGEFVEDEQRNRDSNGTADFDDSITRRKGSGEGEDRLGVTRGD